MLNYHGHPAKEGSSIEDIHLERRVKHEFKIDNPKDMDSAQAVEHDFCDTDEFQRPNGSSGCGQIIDPNGVDDFENDEFTGESNFWRLASGKN